MILIDTNVVSELMRASPAPAVLDWFTHQPGGGLHVSAVSEAELRRGAAILAAGRRRDQIVAAIDAMIAEDFAGRVLPFDSAAAAARRRPPDQPARLPDCRHRARPRGRYCNPQRARFRGLRSPGHRPLG